MKKRFAAVAALVALFFAYAVYAFLTDTDRIENQLNFGADHTDIVEKYEPPEKLEAGASFPKEVQVENTGSVSCFVRIKALFTDEAAMEYASVDYNTDRWEFDPADGYWYYMDAIAPGERTQPLFTTVSIDADAADDQLKDFDIIVYHESYQQGSFSNYKEAWDHYHTNQEKLVIIGLDLQPDGGYETEAGREVLSGSTINKGNLICSAVYNNGHKQALDPDAYTITPETVPMEVGPFDVMASYTVDGSRYDSGTITFEAIHEKPWENTSNGTYQFVQDGDKWTSNNNGVHSTTATSTWEITLGEATPYSIIYKVSSEQSYDKLTITLDGSTIVNGISGNKEEQTYDTTLEAGTHTITATYKKDSSGNSYDDCAYLILEDIPF